MGTYLVDTIDNILLSMLTPGGVDSVLDAMRLKHIYRLLDTLPLYYIL